MSLETLDEDALQLHGSRGLSRREFVTGLAAVGAGAVAPLILGAGPAGAATRSARNGAWSAPRTWGSRIPRQGAHVVISGTVYLDRSVRVASLRILRGGRLEFDRRRNITLTSAGNVVVDGTLVLRPRGPRLNHRLIFSSVNEEAFVGGGMAPLSSDVGLWVTNCGRVRLEGARRTPWVRAATDLRRGSSTLHLAAVPEGWTVGDELAISPTGAPTDEEHSSRFDEARIMRISGNVVTLATHLEYDHPVVDLGDGYRIGAEVLNLTRNVNVEGTPNGRTHTWIHSCCGVSTIRYAGFRHFGPRKRDGGYTKDVLGRYGLHFHMTGDCSRGTVVEGAVARDGGSHAFVAHEADGITMRSCISYNTYETPYWWDQSLSNHDPVATNDLLLDSCVAARVKCDPWFRGYDLAGFMLGAGTGSAALNCVAVGIQGRKKSSGFTWPEKSHGIWDFKNCVAHNNKVHGIFTWQNNAQRHIVERFISYHNGGSGISHGAYINAYVFRDSILYGNVWSAFEMHATSRSPRLILDNLRINGAGISPNGIAFTKHQLPGTEPTLIRACDFKALEGAGIAFTYDGSNGASCTDLVDVVDCTWDGRAFQVGTGVTPDSIIRVSDPVNGALMLQRANPSAGSNHSAWAAAVIPIREFAQSEPKRPLSITVAKAARIS